jgi:hypothetical protein
MGPKKKPTPAAAEVGTLLFALVPGWLLQSGADPLPTWGGNPYNQTY